jgi:MoxR-like ATPase
MKITVPQRKNLGLNDLVFTNHECSFEFVGLDGFVELSGVIIHEYACDTFSLQFVQTVHVGIVKLIDKIFSSNMGKNNFDEAFYVLQKRLKEAVRKNAEGTPDATPEVGDDFEVEAEAPKEAPAKTPKAETPKEVRQVVEVKIERPKAIGLEASINELVYTCLESDYTIQTLQNKMIQLGLEPNRTEIVVKKEGQEPKNVGAQHKEFKTILQTISAGVNVALVGPAGSGKTTCVKHVAEALSLSFYSKSVSAQTGVHEFFGYQDANGNYVRTLFREAYEFGGVFLLDEFDAGNPNVLASMNQATANGSCAFADGMIHKHADFVVVMAGNTFGHGATSEYVGRNAIDKATLDRFAFIYFEYDEEFELSLSTNKDWTKEVQAIRKRVSDKKVKTIVSPRASFDGAKLLSAGMDKETVKKLLIYKGLTSDEINLIK